jgi:hypothetical protein
MRVCENTTLKKIFFFSGGGGGVEGRGGRVKLNSEAGHEMFSVPNMMMIKSRNMVKGNVTCMECDMYGM